MSSERWRKNLFAIFIAEFIVLLGFSFVTPFIPLFAQELGKLTPREAAFWAGIATGASGIAMFLSAPLWGIIADRWGRKPMLLRAQFGSVVVITLTGLSPNLYFLIGLRFLNGLLSGTVSAASAVVSAGTPRDKMPFAMGMLMVATFAGTAFGPLVGGLLADSLGYQNTFFCTAALLLIGGLIVLFVVKEDFQKPEKGKSTSLISMWKLAGSREVLPLLVTLCVLPLGPQIISTNIPLFIKDLDPAGKAASLSGLAYCLIGILAAASSIVAGRISGRISLKKMLFFSCLFTAATYLPPMWAATVAQLTFMVALTGLFKGGIMTSANSLIGLSASGSQQGVIYGIAQSAQSLGNGLGPLIGGPLASLVGFRNVFGISAALFAIVGIFISRTLQGRTSPVKS